MVETRDDTGLPMQQMPPEPACHDGCTRLAVLMTVHNRRETTLHALRKLAAQTWNKPHRVTVYLVDDGSTDGTGEAVRQEFPDVQVIPEDGSLFWNGGMRRAYAAASAAAVSGYIWLNDDTMLDRDACQRLLESAEKHDASAIVAGSVRDPGTGRHTYGGFRVVRRAFAFSLVPVAPDPLEVTACDTMNGNFVYIPRDIAQTLGPLEETFTHQLGDVDYGLRARQCNFDVILAPGSFGTCLPNKLEGTWRDARLPFRDRWRNLLSVKGAPPREWLLFVRRHYGWRWTLYALSPYVQTVCSGLIQTGRRFLGYREGTLGRDTRTRQQDGAAGSTGSLPAK